MSMYNYVDPPNQNLVCCICRCPFVDPCTTRTCCHTFCYECIARAIAISSHCPVDRCPLTVQDLGPADPLIRNLVDELVVECPHKDSGCMHTCQRMLLPAHIKDTCKYVEIPCPDAKCAKGILRKDLASHTHAQDEGSVTEPTVSDSQDSSSGEASSPSNASEAESVTDGGRHPDGARSSSAEAAISSYELLENENARLRLRLSALEGVVNSLKFELQAVRRALGPWYRTADSGLYRGWGGVASQTGRAPGVQSSPSGATSVDPLSTSRTSSSSQDEISIAATASASPHPTSPINRGPAPEFPSGDDISSYFPSVEEEDVYSPDFIRRRQSHVASSQQNAGAGPSHVRDPSLSSHPHLPGTQRAPLPYTQPPSVSATMSSAYPTNAFAPSAYPNIPADLGTIAIPPLDPSMPLPNTLASLHGSIASLAGALGALATTRAQDALYTGEELRSVRAGIHGLRMQFHDMLTAQAVARDSSAGARPGDPDGSVGPGSVSMPGAPANWPPYGPRPYGVSGFAHMPGGFTKL